MCLLDQGGTSHRGTIPYMTANMLKKIARQLHWGGVIRYVRGFRCSPSYVLLLL